MKKLYKITALVLALCLLMGLAACTKTGEDEQADPATSESIPEVETEVGEALALRFAQGILTCNAEDLTACGHEAMQEAFLQSYGANEIVFDSCTVEIEGEEALLQSGREYYTSELNRDYDLQTNIEKAADYTVAFTAEYQGKSYEGKISVLVANFDGGDYVIGADLIEIEDAFYEDNFPEGDYYYDMHGEE